MLNTPSVRRSHLGLPGNERQLAADAMESGADEIFFDLEDSLAPGEKVSARSTLIDIVRETEWSDTGLSYRINGTETRWWYEDVVDVISAVGEAIDTLIVPKVTGPGDIRTVETLLSSLETNTGLDSGSVGLSAQIETAEGMNNVVDIAHVSDRLTAVIFGPADYAASIGATHGATDYPGHYWHYPLSRIAHAAASADLLAIGGPYTDPDDSQGFRQACLHERALGFDGKVVIHPAQVETANEIFSPDTEEIRRAREIVETYERTESDEIAAIEGKVIDREMYRMADQILTKAREADLL
jgi:citrate lyase subunit beta/citryl-CoA lyase